MNSLRWLLLGLLALIVLAFGIKSGRKLTTVPNQEHVTEVVRAAESEQNPSKKPSIVVTPSPGRVSVSSPPNESAQPKLRLEGISLTALPALTNTIFAEVRPDLERFEKTMKEAHESAVEIFNRNELTIKEWNGGFSSAYDDTNSGQTYSYLFVSSEGVCSQITIRDTDKNRTKYLLRFYGGGRPMSFTVSETSEIVRFHTNGTLAGLSVRVANGGEVLAAKWSESGELTINERRKAGEKFLERR